MSIGSVTVATEDLMQNIAPEIERMFLFVGTLPDGNANGNRGSVHEVDGSTDLNELLGEDDSDLKSHLENARANGGMNWCAKVLPIAATSTLLADVDKALEAHSVEALCLTDAITTSTEINNIQTKADELITKYNRRVFFVCFYPTITPPAPPPPQEEIEPEIKQQSQKQVSFYDDGMTWTEYLTAAKAITNTVVADRVVILPLLFFDFFGAFCGRLSRQDVSIADSPMRVKTGALVGNFSELPVDNTGAKLTKAHIKELHDTGRFTTVTWYEDYDGMYTSDAYCLTVDGSNFRRLEHLRIVDKAARGIYQVMVPMVRDRQINSTADGIECTKQRAMEPLLAMSQSQVLGGSIAVGEIKPVEAGDIVVVWKTHDEVHIGFTIKSYNSASTLHASIALDISGT